LGFQAHAIRHLLKPGDPMRSKFRGSWTCAYFACALLGGACEKTEEQPGGTAAAPLEQAAAPESQPAPAAVTAPAGAKVFFIEPTDGAELTGPVVDGKVQISIKMGVEGIGVQAAGQQVQGMGHHHLIIDGEHIPLGSVVPKDDSHIHFGAGQTETKAALSPGEHSLVLQFADGAHLSYGDQLSARIKIKVLDTPAPVDHPTDKAAPPDATQKSKKKGGAPHAPH